MKETLVTCRRLLGTLRRICGQRWGPAPSTMLPLYRGLILSRLCYALPLLSLTACQERSIATFHRVALRLCLGLPSYAPNVATLVEAQDTEAMLVFGERALRHLSRMHSAPSASDLLHRLECRPNSKLGQLTAIFSQFIGSPGYIPPSPPPHTGRPPLSINCSSSCEKVTCTITGCPLKHRIIHRLEVQELQVDLH